MQTAPIRNTKMYLKCSRNKKNTCVRVRPVFFARVRFSSGVGYLRWNQIKSSSRLILLFYLNIYLLCLYISFKEFRDFSWMDMIIITLIFFVIMIMIMMLMMLMMLTIPWNNRQSPLRPRWCVEGETFFSADICRPHLNILLPHICVHCIFDDIIMILSLLASKLHWERKRQKTLPKNGQNTGS